MREYWMRLRGWTPVGDLRAFWQRGRRGWAARDAWSFDSYLAPVIAGAVGEIRRAAHGHPGNLPGVREWAEILAKIEYGFKTYAEGEEWGDPAVKEAMRLFAMWFPHLWD